MIILTLAETTVESMRTTARFAFDRLTRAQAVERTGHDIFFEVRLDRLSDPGATVDLSGIGGKTLATLRSRAHGGDGATDPAERAAILDRAARWADLIDLEWPHDVDLAERWGERAILSLHSFGRPFDETVETHRAMRRHTVKRKKIATTVSSLVELGRLLEFSDAWRDDASLFALGEIGSVSRWRLLARGSHELFFASATDRPAAPGQPTIDDVLGRLGAIAAAKRHAGLEFLALVGQPTTHSLSPVGYTSAIAALDRPIVYVTLPCDDPIGIEKVAAVAPFRGFSVTAPHKVAVARLCADMTPMARAIGAVNTVTVAADGSFYGANTDVDGVTEPIGAHYSRSTEATVPPGRALLLGTGGAAQAAAFALTRLGWTVDVLGRNRSAAFETAKPCGGRGIGIGDELGAERWNVLLNALPGQAVDELPCDLEQFVRRCDVLFDMNYRLTGKRFADLAARCGKPLIPGIEMFLAQGQKQLGILVSSDPSAVAAFRTAVLSAFAETRSS